MPALESSLSFPQSHNPPTWETGRAPREGGEVASNRSGSLTAVMAEQPAEASATSNSTSRRAFPWAGVDQAAAQALVVPLFVVMNQILPKRPAKVILAERDQAVQAFSADREHEALGVGVQVGAA